MGGRGAQGARPPSFRSAPPHPRAPQPGSPPCGPPPAFPRPPPACFPRSSSPPAPSGRLLPPYHVSPPHVEKVPVHHGAVAAPLLGHAELLRGVCRHLRRRRRRKQFACLGILRPATASSGRGCGWLSAGRSPQADGKRGGSKVWGVTLPSAPPPRAGPGVEAGAVPAGVPLRPGVGTEVAVWRQLAGFVFALLREGSLSVRV